MVISVLRDLGFYRWIWIFKQMGWGSGGGASVRDGLFVYILLFYYISA